MLDADVKAQLKAYLERLVQPIELVANVDDSEGSRDMMELLRDVAEQSGMISLTEQRDAAERAPSFLIRRTGADVSVRFAAVPTGHEFTSLVLALLQVGGYSPSSMPTSSSRSATSKAISASRRTCRSRARTARTWSRR